ncbi:hypothetical protein GF351_02740 [Candidatus Woesearchaeota archaeon]|nr:hypothetical protein [Candidatus Woesearchaeota archaeon]
MADPRLVRYIRETRAAGFRIDTVRDALVERGWPEQKVHDAVKAVMTAHGAARHSLHPAHLKKNSGLVVSLCMVFAGCYAFAVISKPLSYLIPGLANPLGEYLLAPLILAFLVVLVTMGVAVAARGILG